VRTDAPIATIPNRISFDEAAPVCDGGILALSCLRAGGLHNGQRILIYGASGSIGTSAVQLARHFGAEVTAVCDTKSLDEVRSLAPDSVIDYTKEDFTETGVMYDVVFDAVGKTSFWRCRHMIKPGGFYLDTDLGFLWQNPGLILLTKLVRGKRVLIPIPKYTKENVEFLRQLLAQGQFRAVVDSSYPLAQVVEATEYVEMEQKIGNVVLKVAAS
jgi:NADPH:quinone reductase-like Zn-dependent oxidoreductase